MEIDGRSVAVRTYPIAIDAPALRRQAAGAARPPRPPRAVRWKGDARMILRVDRTDLSKNILRGFLAYETLLHEQPELRGRVQFLALLNASRRAIPEYRAYTRDCLRAAERINDELGTPDWQPVTVTVRDDLDRAVAAFSMYDVLLVNPVFDGMNLVAMEGPTVNRTDGVLVLSRNAGADALLGRHALSVNPFDVEETASAMLEALHMPADERHRRGAGLRRRSGPTRRRAGSGSQLADLEAGGRGPRRPDRPSAVEPAATRSSSNPTSPGAARRRERSARRRPAPSGVSGPATATRATSRPFAAGAGRARRTPRGRRGRRPRTATAAGRAPFEQPADRAALPRPPGRNELDHHLALDRLESRRAVGQTSASTAARAAAGSAACR